MLNIRKTFHQNQSVLDEKNSIQVKQALKIAEKHYRDKLQNEYRLDSLITNTMLSGGLIFLLFDDLKFFASITYFSMAYLFHHYNTQINNNLLKTPNYITTASNLLAEEQAIVKESIAIIGDDPELDICLQDLIEKFNTYLISNNAVEAGFLSRIYGFFSGHKDDKPIIRNHYEELPCIIQTTKKDKYNMFRQSSCDSHINNLMSQKAQFTQALKMHSSHSEPVNFYNEEGTFLYCIPEDRVRRALTTFDACISILIKMKNYEYITLNDYNILMLDNNIRKDLNIMSYSKIHRDNEQNIKSSVKPAK